MAKTRWQFELVWVWKPRLDTTKQKKEMLLAAAFAVLFCTTNSFIWKQSYVGRGGILHAESKAKPFKTAPRKKSPPSTSAEKNKKPPDSWNVLIKKLEETKADDKFSKKAYQNATMKSMEGKDELKCKHFDYCSGCIRKGQFTETLVMMEAQNFFTMMDAPFTISVGNVTAWRTHVKLAVQPLSKWGGLKIGLFKEGTHEVVMIPDCVVQHPRLNEAVEVLRLAAIDAGVKGYEPSTARRPSIGELRYIQLSLERKTGKVQAVLVWNGQPSDASQSLSRLLKLLAKRTELWHSVSVNYNTMSNNVIFNYDKAAWRLLWGPPFIKETIGNATFILGPQTFRQANLDFFESHLIPTVQKYVPKGSIVSELYSGVGVLGLNLASKADAVLCSDANPFVDEVFDRGVQSLGNELAEKVFFECLDAEAAVSAGQCQDATVLVVDPPRRGLNDNVMNFLLNKLPAQSIFESKLERMIYVGCGFEAVMRDTKLLTASGLWKLTGADGFALFPGTDHIEVVVVFDRVTAGNKAVKKV